MNFHNTLHVSTPKPARKQGSFKDLVMSSNTSKKEINVFVPRVAFLDIASNRKMKQTNLLKNLDSTMGHQTACSVQKRTRPLMTLSRVAMLEEDYVPVEPVSSLLLGVMP